MQSIGLMENPHWKSHKYVFRYPFECACAYFSVSNFDLMCIYVISLLLLYRTYVYDRTIDFVSWRTRKFLSVNIFMCHKNSIATLSPFFHFILCYTCLCRFLLFILLYTGSIADDFFFSIWKFIGGSVNDWEKTTNQIDNVSIFSC